MQFIDHDEAQILKELHPLGVMRQNTGMQHVRIGDDNLPGDAHGTARGRGRIAVECVSLDIEPGIPRQFKQLDR